MRRVSPLYLLLFSVLLAGCATNNQNTITQKRQAILNMKDRVLADLYKVKPDVKAQIANAPGYAVFSNANVNVVLASFGGGHGVVRDNSTGKHSYMKMGEVGVGLGLGIKDFRAIFVFHTPASIKRFIEHGWTFGAQADAAVKAGDKGAAIAGEAIMDNVTIYQLTESGLALQATLKGTKFWKNSELN